MSKHIWNIASNKKSLWVKWVHVYKLDRKTFWDLRVDAKASCCWRSVLNLRDAVRGHIVSIIGDGKTTSLWFDNWHPLGPLCNIVSRKDIVSSGLKFKSVVSDVFIDGVWMWPMDLFLKYGSVLSSFFPVLVSGMGDKVKWRDNHGRFKDFDDTVVWEDFCATKNEVQWSKLVWFSQNIPRYAFILWLAVNERLNTQDRLEKWKIENFQFCAFCKDVKDSHCHLFTEYSYAKQVWEGFKGLANMDSVIDGICSGNLDLKGLIDKLVNRPISKSIWSVIQRLVLAATVYHLWQERNFRLFQKKYRAALVLIQRIIEVVRLRLLGLKINCSVQSKLASDIWKFGMVKRNFLIDCDDFGVPVGLVMVRWIWLVFIVKLLAVY